MTSKRTRRDTMVFDAKRMFFIKSEVVRGNLKPRRARNKTGVISRLMARLEVNKLRDEVDCEEEESAE